MKHVSITLLCIAGIAIYTFLSCRYISTYTVQTLTELNNINSTTNSISSIENIKDIYDKRKKLLLFMVNKDHLDEAEDIISELKSAIMYSNEQDIQTGKEQLKSIIEEIKRASHTLY